MTMERETQADIAVIGLAVMGQNLILNMNDHGYTVAAYNRTVSRVDEFMAGDARGSRVIGAHSLEAMIAQLKRPRRVMLMVKAGKPVDDFIALLLPHLAPGDVIIDGGNSQFTDTIRRTKWMEEKGLLYIGTGISGEEGARRGPSIMPGGNPTAWPLVKDPGHYRRQNPRRLAVLRSWPEYTIGTPTPLNGHGRIRRCGNGSQSMPPIHCRCFRERRH